MAATIKEKSCGTVVYHKKDDGYEFLLLHYPEGHWDFPKGHVEKDETEIETALRELEEETDIKDGKVHEGFREKMHYFFQHKEKLISKDVIYFLVEASDQDVALSHEHKNFLWLSYEEAHEKMTFENGKEILKKGFEFLAR
ncbi:bis(5'-nucleosyl)-tetraphosphatase [Patescibacteria group bacterium]